MCNNTCTGSVHPNITPAGQVQDGNNNCRVTPGTHNLSVVAQTVRNGLREAGLRACRPVVRQVLTKHHRQQRPLWAHAQTHRRWTRQDWQKVLFTDESLICLTRDYGRFRVHRRRNGGSVMVWGGVSQHDRTEHVVIADNLNTVHYREDILLPHVVPFQLAHPDLTLQHDNATNHTARPVRYREDDILPHDFLQDRNVSVLPWPATSPNRNPIEHVWDLLDRRVMARAIPPRNARELAGAWWNSEVTSQSKNLMQLVATF